MYFLNFLVYWNNSLKEVGKMNGGKVKNYKRIKYKTERLPMVRDDVWENWNECFEGLYNVDTEEQVRVNNVLIIWGKNQ